MQPEKSSYGFAAYLAERPKSVLIKQYLELLERFVLLEKKLMCDVKINVIPPLPLESKFFRRVRVVDEDRKRLRGLLIFSPFSYDEDVASWSHDREFPWFLQHPEKSFVVRSEEQKSLIAAAAYSEFIVEAKDPKNKSKKKLLNDIAGNWLTWATKETLIL